MKKLSKKALNKCYTNWMMYNLSSMSFERLEAYGFCHSMLPVIEELYGDNEEERKAAISRHSSFYNTEPQIGVVVNGIVAGLEESRANGNDVDESMINGLKIGLMGPLAGIGDSMIPGLLIPILLSIGMGLSAGGSILGPIFYILTYNLVIIFGTRYLFFKGYTLGTDSVKYLVGETSTKLRESFSIIGLFVIGGVAASFVNLTTKLQYSYEALDIEGNVITNVINVQNILDGVFPKLLTLVIVLFTWFLMSKKNMSPLKTMLILLVVSVVGVALGIF